ncbi:MAG TPA: hypothetical protein VGS07_27195 [Thermoanaerobaculia bacterium]|jgi:hypothetical protein|nr:hypothetical protein [Thermoanaerobaculia bacterium]
MGAVTSFVDPRVTGKDFTRFFLQCPECHIGLLARFAGEKGSRKKETLAWALADRLEAGVVSADEFMLAYALQPRTWLSFKVGSASRLPEYQLGHPAQLLREFGSGHWYGPLSKPGGGQIYLRPFEVPHIALVSDRPIKTRVRWTVVAEVHESWVSLAWNGFTSRRDEEEVRGAQFPFWEHIPTAFEELKESLGGKWSEISLNKLVLNDLWDKFVDKPDYRWEHLRVRAEAAGVALNARSARIVSDVDTKGLEKLTSSIAKSAIFALGVPLTPENRARAENSILRTLIHHWGTISYEFALSRLSDVDPEKALLFHAHCYFGQRASLSTQDSLQHLKCYRSAGGDSGARDFLLAHLQGE